LGPHGKRKAGVREKTNNPEGPALGPGPFYRRLIMLKLIHKKTILAIIILIMLLATSALAQLPTTSRPVVMYSNTGNALKVNVNGATDVFIQDQTTDIVDLYLHKHIGSDITITSNTAVGDRTINVASGHGAVAGNVVCLKEGERYYQGTILSVTATKITLDTPLDYAFTTGAYCSPTTIDLNVDGSVTPVEFHIRPNVGVKWDITRVMFYIEGTGTMDSGLFGDIAALTNGVVLRKKDGTYKNIFNVKSNGDFANRAYDISYDSRAPAGTSAVRVRRSFGGQDKNGVVVRLDGTSLDELEILVQDNLTGLVNFYVIAQGHIVED
jgi:hypothetical protein